MADDEGRGPHTSFAAKFFRGAPDTGVAKLPARPQAEPAADGLDAPRRYWAWATIMVGLTLAVLDGSIANVALPTIAADFQASPSVSIWIVNGYQLAIVVTLLPFANLGESYGYLRVYLAGVSLFTIASVGCAFADSLGALTAARIVQGIGGAGLMSVNTALVRYIVPKARFGAAVGFNALGVSAAATIGPTLAGFILSLASWPWLFAINVPLGITAVTMGLFSLPQSDRSARRFDWRSAILSAATIGLMITTIDSIGHELPAPWIVAQIVTLIAAATLLVRRELNVREPLMPLDLIKLPVFTLSVGTSIASFVAQMMTFVSLPFAFQTIYGFSPVQVGMLMMPWPVAVAVAAPVAGKLSDRYSPAILSGAGLLLLAAGLLLMALLPHEPSAADIVWRMAMCGVGFGFFQTPNNRTLITAAPKARSGAASGMLGTARLTGQTTGAALVALLLARFGITGAIGALGVAAAFAAIAAVISISRIGAFKKARAEA
jgi:DHA2 family multidrug resistance protein-like MFS transporter